ncbi:MAG: hypothetical protein AB1560_01190 [Pseudomonadota bacterium]
MSAQRGFRSMPFVRFCLFSLLLASNVSLAEEWWMSPSLRLEGEYNDNISLTTQPHSSVRSTLVAPRLDLGVQAPVWQVSGSAEFLRQSYSDRSNLGRDRQYYRFSSKYLTERSTWRLDGNRSYAPVLVGDTVDPDVGLAPIRKERKSTDIYPSWTWMMTELTQLQLAYQKNDATYENGELFGLFDYSSRGVTAGMSHQLSFRTKASLNFAYSIFDVPANRFESRSSSVMAGLSHSFSDTLSASFSVGAQRTVSDGFIRGDCLTRELVGFFDSDFNLTFVEVCTAYDIVSVSQDRTTNLINASLEKKFEATRLSASFGRSITPSGTGVLSQTDTLSIQVSRAFSSRLTGKFLVGAYDVSSGFEQFTDTDRRLYYVNPAMVWQWTPRWGLETALRYNRLKYDNSSDTATSRAVFLKLLYSGPKMSISR